MATFPKGHLARKTRGTNTRYFKTLRHEPEAEALAPGFEVPDAPPVDEPPGEE